MIKAVVFDLDDTLFPEIEYVKSGFKAIETYLGVPGTYEKLYDLFCKDKNNVYQRMGFSEELCLKCIEIYRNHYPDITLPDQSQSMLLKFKSLGYKLGIITDGRPIGQRNKIIALGLDSLVDYIIVTDELGGIEFRKPHKKSFEIMCKNLNVKYNEMIYVGDNPKKDFFISSILPIKTVQVKSKSLYSDKEYSGGIIPQYRIDSLEELLCIDLIN